MFSEAQYDFQLCLKIFSFKEKLGRGGFGKVYKVIDKYTKKQYAIKFTNQKVASWAICQWKEVEWL